MILSSKIDGSTLTRASDLTYSIPKSRQVFSVERRAMIQKKEGPKTTNQASQEEKKPDLSNVPDNMLELMKKLDLSDDKLQCIKCSYFQFGI